MNDKITLTPIGGFGEVGKNTLLFEINKEIFIIDAGIKFSADDEDIDIILPDLEYIYSKREKIKGIFITHGHEDHIGALPKLEFLKVPIFCSPLTKEILKKKLNKIINAVAKKEKCKTKIEYRVSGEAFYTQPNKEILMVKKVVKKVTGNSAKLNCKGGTSDSRFLGSIPRLELGLRNNTIHMVDEKTSISDLKKLTKIYFNILENYFK